MASNGSLTTIATLSDSFGLGKLRYSEALYVRAICDYYNSERVTLELITLAGKCETALEQIKGEPSKERLEALTEYGIDLSKECVRRLPSYGIALSVPTSSVEEYETHLMTVAAFIAHGYVEKIASGECKAFYYETEIFGACASSAPSHKQVWYDKGFTYGAQIFASSEIKIRWNQRLQATYQPALFNWEAVYAA